MRKKIILIGPNPEIDSSEHPGGQLTAAAGIVAYAREKGYDLSVINTRINCFQQPPFLKKVRQAFARLLALLRIASHGDLACVILFAGSGYSFFERVLLAAISKAFGANTLFCIRNGYFVDWMESSKTGYWLIRRLLRIPKYIIVQGLAFQHRIIAAGVPPARVQIVHNWLPNAFEILNNPKIVDSKLPLRLIFVGWLVKEKGILELCNAIRDLVVRHQVVLDIVGGGTLEVELRRQVSLLPKGCICIHGWLPPSSVISLLDRSHIFVLPTYYEGFPNALLEAMARGLPAICTDVGGIPDSIVNGENGFLVPARDTQALKIAIQRYLESPELVRLHSVSTLIRVKNVHDSNTNLASLFSMVKN